MAGGEGAEAASPRTSAAEDGADDGAPFRRPRATECVAEIDQPRGDL